MFSHPKDIEAGQTVSCDMCIVGAGAAGITLAVELQRSSLDVVLVEAGAFKPPPVDDHHPYAGTCIGIPYSLTATRLRYFGGTTNHWGGWCRPLDPLDFEERSFVPHSGWPITHSQLLPFYERAQEICEIDPPGFGTEEDVGAPTRERYFHAHDSDFTVKVFRFSPPTRFGRRYRAPIEKGSNLRCLLESSAVEIDALENRVSRIRVKAGGKEFFVQAANYVLAMGAIENARLLLHSDDRHKGGIGNQGDCLGRFFADHLGKTIGGVLTVAGSPYVHRKIRGVSVFPHLSFSEDFLRREGLLNCGIVFLSKADHPLLDEDYLDESRLFEGWGGSPEKTFFRVLARMETAPNPESVVRLTREKDGNGVRRVELDWKLSGMEEYCLHRITDILGRKIGALSMGRFRQTFVGGEEFQAGDFSTQAHHLGTTRMSERPIHGVVDPNCRVHGISNLFVAGSSVFPTFGFANPTLTLVALAVRLAGFLRKQPGIGAL